MEYALTRSKRKTLSLIVRKDGRVDVRAPMRLPKAQIDVFVQKHESWVQKQLDRLAEAAQQRRDFAYADGDSFPFGGGELFLAAGADRWAQQQDDQLLLPIEDRPAVVAAFLREEARRQVTQRIGVFASLLEVVPAGVKITSATTRWGSCSGKDSLCFAYRIACLPLELLDYIVVHELAHIREHNHSPRFWAVVEAVLPDWRIRRAQLRAFQSQLPF